MLQAAIFDFIRVLLGYTGIAPELCADTIAAPRVENILLYNIAIN